MSEWIPNKERRPNHQEVAENEALFLVTAVNDVEHTDIDEYNILWNRWENNNKVIAWQPLPKPYKEPLG